jgi:hypothetical protein
MFRANVLQKSKRTFYFTFFRKYRLWHNVEKYKAEKAADDNMATNTLSEYVVIFIASPLQIVLHERVWLLHW